MLTLVNTITANMKLLFSFCALFLQNKRLSAFLNQVLTDISPLSGSDPHDSPVLTPESDESPFLKHDSPKSNTQS